MKVECLNNKFTETKKRLFGPDVQNTVQYMKLEIGEIYYAEMQVGHGYGRGMRLFNFKKGYHTIVDLDFFVQNFKPVD